MLRDRDRNWKTSWWWVNGVVSETIEKIVHVMRAGSYCPNPVYRAASDMICLLAPTIR
jgi:hypothetical protein